LHLDDATRSVSRADRRLFEFHGETSANSSKEQQYVA
jgi:hypothetical protein